MGARKDSKKINTGHSKLILNSQEWIGTGGSFLTLLLDSSNPKENQNLYDSSVKMSSSYVDIYLFGTGLRPTNSTDIVHYMVINVICY
ncbi:unnamed protein product [Caretta caretta]